MSTPRMVIHTLEELKEKAALALKDPKLVELVRNTALNSGGSNRGKVNLAQVDKESFDYALGETGSPKRAEELRKSTRALAMIRRDYEERFERLISQIKERREERNIEGRKPFVVEIDLPWNVQITAIAGSGTRLRVSGAFPVRDTVFVCRAMFGKLIQADPRDFDWQEQSRVHPEVSGLRQLMIQILEEKFGMKVVDADSSEEETEKAARYREPEESDSVKVGDHILVDDSKMPGYWYRPRVLEVITVRETQVAARRFEEDKEPLYSQWFNIADVQVVPKLPS